MDPRAIAFALLMVGLVCSQPGWETSSSSNWETSTDESISTQEVTNVEMKMPFEFDSVSAQRRVNDNKPSVSGARLKRKALNILSMKTVLKSKCDCGFKCLNGLTIENIRKARQYIWTLDHPARIQKLIELVSTSTKPGKFRFIGMVNSERMLCSSAFKILYRINKNTMSKVLNMYKDGLLSAATKKPRDLSDNTLVLLDWVEQHSSRYGDRMPTSNEVLLPYGTKQNDIYRMYRAEMERRSEKPVSLASFYRIWQTYFPHVKAKKTTSFTKCSTCLMLERQMTKTTCSATRTKYAKLKEEHNERQMMERKYYYSKRDASRSNPDEYLSLIVDGMDQSKTNLPHFTGRRSKSINGADLLKTHVTGVLNHGHGGFFTYVNVNEYPSDPNLTINVILKMLKKTAERFDNTLPKILYLQADNCWRENKNRYVLGFCQLLVAEKIFNEVHLSFLYVGHTHEDVDAGFSKISQKLKGSDAETFDQFISLLPNAENLSVMYDVKAWLQDSLSDITKLTQPLHYKFVANNVYFKGQSSDNWETLNGPILTNIPKGQPQILQPDFTRISIENHSKLMAIRQRKKDKGDRRSENGNQRKTKRRRGSYTVNNVLTMVSSDEEKKHIWFNIFSDILAGVLFYLLFLISFLTFTVRTVMFFLTIRFFEEVYIHMGHHCAFMSLCWSDIHVYLSFMFSNVKLLNSTFLLTSI